MSESTDRAAEHVSSGPLADVRVLDLSNERAGAVCTMLLADLGADVVRPFVPGGVHERTDAPEHVATVCWDRGKRYVRVDALDPSASDDMAALVASSDVIVIDERPSRLAQLQLTYDRLAHGAPQAVIGWFPMNGTFGADAELPSDPLVLSAISGYAQLQCSATDTPIAPVIPATSNIHGALGASSVIAGLIERRRSGVGQVVTITGLHAAALMVATLSGEALDAPETRRPQRDPRTAPTFRIYRCGDGEWLFLGALTPALFITAIDAMDVMELLLLPGIDGEFLNMFVGDNGFRMSEGLERRFAEMPRAYWLEVLGKASVPAAPVSTREEWLASEPFADTGGSVVREHAALGTVRIPSPPLEFSASSVAVGPLSDQSRAPSAHGVWAPRSALAPDEPDVPLVPDAPALAPDAPSEPPLAGLRVVDMSGFMAGPIGPLLLGQWGAEVIKVEPPIGDPYRIFSLSYASVNQGKPAVTLDMTVADDRAVLGELVNGADIVVDNLRASQRERFALDTATLSAANPNLIHTTVAAFSGSGPWSKVPGFDPVLQAWSGLMHASGDDEQPYYTSTGYHDVATGAMSTLGSMAALYARQRLGRGQRVMVSLASSTKLVQLEEFTLYDSRPEPARGGIDYVGSGPMHRYYRVSDGWVAVCGPDDRLDALEQWAGGSGSDIEGAMRARTRAQAVAQLTGLGITAVRVVEGDERASDPHLTAHSVLHVVDDPGIGRCRVVNNIASWSRSATVEITTVPAMGSGQPVWGIGQH